MSKNQQFQKFITYKSNAAKKEQFKQEKRAAKKERAAAIEKRFEEKRTKKEGGFSREAEGNSRESVVGSHQSKPINARSKTNVQQPPQKKDIKNKTYPSGPLVAKDTPAAPVQDADHRKTAGKPVRAPKPGSREEKNLLAGRPDLNTKPEAGGKKSAPGGKQPAGANQDRGTGNFEKSGTRHEAPNVKHQTSDKIYHTSDLMPLNKYVAHSGICSRRDAADLIRQGEVKVNDVVVTEPGTKVSPKDSISIKGKKITPSKNLVYILLNKPKDYITTLDDPEGRKTVLDLIKRATDERVYPVGRLDRNTSGVLLITNDGELAQTLSHPSNLIKKIYEVRLDKPLSKADFEKLQTGVQLDDGFIMPDALGYTDPKDKTIIGIEIHSGRNRIVRRIFEYLGYDVRNLDRVTYAGLTKKNVQRGKWRFLTEKEVRILRHFNPQTKKDKAKKVVPPANTAKIVKR
jgi:23S rRNA pseudouridine2605 synthase